MSKKFKKNFKTSKNNYLNTSSKYKLKRNYGLCSDCKRPNTSHGWCQNCNSKIFQKDFDKWTSGNKYIDKFIQETQMKAKSKYEVIEWIPYNQIRNIEYLAKGGFSTIYTANWYDYISVVLKSLNNSSNINDDFLNALKNHLQFNSTSDNSLTVRIYGITQDPETSNYMILMQYINGGNLRSNLLIKKHSLFEKYKDLSQIAAALSTLHTCNLIHGDFHREIFS
ncbi:kinase-like domain-containing protein [Glomus cerebriforme]|uniref:Kinase-like domain-containing protein n=1 Tax=Glomus cerebriforme TaxID=658196 RepID=A0A397SJQ6_9GLOM|nr:kinase-like domain-containing protein [Glomus cerebriforme]